MTYLSEIKTGTAFRVSSIEGGHNLHMRLADLGLIQGQHAKVLSNDKKGPLLLMLGHTRIALGRHMAQKIRVEIEDNSNSRTA